MHLIFKIIIHIFINAIAILTAVYFVDGIELEITFINLVKVGAVLGIVNTFIRPVAKLLSFPFIILTFGLFSIIINTSLLLFVSYLMQPLSIDGFWSAFWGVIIISLVNYALSLFIKD